MIAATDLLRALPVAVYITDAAGRITFYNEAAAEFWGHRPRIGIDEWCGSWRLFWPDGRPMRHDECPMAIALKEGRELRGVEALAERPDGTRVPFTPYPTLLRDESGKVLGAINLLIDLVQRKDAEIQAARLAAIVTSSNDAIVSKTLDGIVTSWNAGAARIFGYEPEEIIGKPIKQIIPEELHPEEDEIIAGIRRGERVEHYDTVRIAKSGRRVHVSLTVSPLINGSGRVIGASKVARDVTERKRAEELQQLLFDELNHRVKNTLASVQAIASQSLRRASHPGEFVTSFTGRMQALARAHDLLVRGEFRGAGVADIVHEQVVIGAADTNRIVCEGPSIMLAPRIATQLGLVLHELATNARKYGALSGPQGRLSISWCIRADASRELSLAWNESEVPDVHAPTARGFGTTLIERTLDACGGDAVLQYEADGLRCRITVPLPEQQDRSWSASENALRREITKSATTSQTEPELRGKRIAVIEDEPLIAMELEAELTAIGCNVAGLAATVEKARRVIEEGRFDAALLDANLGGHAVDELAAALTAKGIPFAFATGYGREALPPGFRDAIVLTKPFGSDQLLNALKALLGPRSGASGVLSMRARRASLGRE
jgi:PAS domain S-box-containing protein